MLLCFPRRQTHALRRFKRYFAVSYGDVQDSAAAVSHDMDIRINDYQMYLSGERLENFAGVFGWFTGPITSFVGLIIPILLLKYGFNSNWDVLFIDSSRIKIIVIPILFDIAGYLLMTIPYFFWDYDDDKQNKVMEVLRRREEVTRKKYNEEHGIVDDDEKITDDESTSDEVKETAEVM